MKLRHSKPKNITMATLNIGQNNINALRYHAMALWWSTTNLQKSYWSISLSLSEKQI